MKLKKTKSVTNLLKTAGLLFALISTTSWSQVAVDTINAEAAVGYLLGEGIEATNITSTGSFVQLGYLTEGEGTILGMDSGIVLSTDHVDHLEGGFGTLPFGTGISGDADLLEIANDVPDLIDQNFSVNSVNDLSILEFDFVPTGTEIGFNYVFGSDEWTTYINSQYNDIFAFFLSGPGITGPYDSPAEFPDGAINIAYLPDTDPPLPITISSVNNGNPNGTNCVNCEYYVYNSPNVDIMINAFTTVLTASSEVLCGETYHIKLAIADGSDTALESVVILEAGSFQASEPSIVIDVEAEGADIGENTIIEGCLGGSFYLTRTSCSETDSLTISIGGTATNGVDYLEIPETLIFEEDQIVYVINVIAFTDNITEGSETITLEFEYEDAQGEMQLVSGTINILDLSEPEVVVDDLYICPGETVTAVAEGSQGIGPYTYTWSTDDVGPEVDFSQGSAGTYTVNVEDWCLGTGQTSFNVEEPNPFESIADTVYVCYARETPTLVSGGRLPYSYDYDPLGLKLDEDHASFLGLKEGEFEVSITDDCGQVRDILVIVDFCDTTIPNIITPPSTGTGDGYNDKFVIDGIEGFPGSALTVYNRWGQIVFDVPSYNNEWDAEGMAEGVYYYIFSRSDGKSYSGYFQIVRE